MTCICAKLVSAAHANHSIKSNWIYFCVFLVIYLKNYILKWSQNHEKISNYRIQCMLGLECLCNVSFWQRVQPFMWRPIFTSSVFWWAGHFSMSFDWLAAKVECDWLLFDMWRVQKATLCLCHHFRENLDFHWSIPNQKRSINSIALNFTYILLNKIQWLPQSGGL